LANLYYRNDQIGYLGALNVANIAIFQHDPECSEQCCDAMVEILSPSHDIKIINEKDLNKETLKDVQLIVFGGGIGDSDKYYDFFKRREGNLISDFIAGGGCYLGICMGAYWASRDYFDILNDIEPVQYIKRPNADIRRSYATVADVLWMGRPESMFFYDGCTFVGNGEIITLARYANGDPMAIAQGRVGLIGCHPEAKKEWYDQYKYLKKKWSFSKDFYLVWMVNYLLMREKHERMAIQEANGGITPT